MKEIDISNSQFKEVTFVSSDLSLSNLDGIVIDKALFQEMDLSERDLSGIRMFGAQMIGCNLSGVNFTDAILEKCSFIKANLVNSILSLGLLTFPVNKTEPLLRKIFVSAINSLSYLKIRLEILVFIRLSLIVVPNPFSLDAAPKETIPTVPMNGPQDWRNKAIIDIYNKFFTIKFLST